MMVFVTALKPRGSTLHLLPRCYISCCQDSYSASHSFTVLTYLVLQFFLCVFLLLNFCFTNKLIKYSNVISMQFSPGDGETKEKDPT